MNYPDTRREDVVDEHFGRKVADPFRWLEGDARGNADVAAWVDAQNAVTQDYLAKLPGRDVLNERLRALLDYERLGPPMKRAGRYFFARNAGQDNQWSLWLREGDGATDRMLIDPDGWSADQTQALAEWAPSDDGKLVAYGIQIDGTDWRTIRVLDVDSGKTLADEICWARFSGITWASDGSGFFYSRYPAPESGARSTAAVTDHAVHFHAIGTPAVTDRLIHSTPDRPDLIHTAHRTDDGRFLVIHSSPGIGANALTVVDLRDEDRNCRPLIAGFDAQWFVIDSRHDTLFVLTSHGAERRRVVTFDLSQAAPEPVEIVAEDSAVLTTVALVGGCLVATYLVDVKTEVRRFRLDGTPDGVVTLPGIGTAGPFQGQATDDEAFFVFSSFDTPTTICRYDVAADRTEAWARSPVAADLGSITVEQRFCRSGDGTPVPLFVIRRNDATLPAPTLLYGYGGFGLSLVPFYSSVRIAWIEQGGVLAVANIRGGGEYGRAWHKAGMRESKQNAFDDFIAAAEFLKAEGIAADDGLAIQGDSNGGLLVGAVVNQRPDLFAAALPGVGVMDMLRFPRFTGGHFWIAEYGNPAEAEHFDRLLGYSPCHNIHPGVRYPAILASTADTDDRVVPAHTFKYVAALQARDLGPRPRLARIEARAGHGAGMPLDKVIALHADLWAVAAHWTGLAIRPIAEH